MRYIIVDAFLERERQIQNGMSESQLNVFEKCRAPRMDYCILSHRWTTEVTYEEMESLTKIENKNEIRSRSGYQKILRCCERTQCDGLGLLWIDTCCVDFSNVPETSDVINSMFQLYQNSKYCYAYLHDTSVFPTRRDDKMFGRFDGWPEWFSRGWTLQELIAPENLRFFNKDWEYVGDKRSLAPKLAEITKVPVRVLRDGLSSYHPSAAQVISWAADRRTLCVEDRAYSLLGLLDVNMPVLYGEGKRAFLRLQLEVMRMSNDQSIFAWKHSVTCSVRWTGGVLADDPIFFRDCHDVIKMEPKEFYEGLSLLWESDAKGLVTSQGDEGIPAFIVTNGAIQIRLPLLPYYGCPSVFLAALACRKENDPLPVTIGLASFASNYYRYSGATGPLQLLPQYRQLSLAYRGQRSQAITFKLDDRMVPYYGFTRTDVLPDGESLAGNSLRLSDTSPLAIVSYVNSAVNSSFAIAFGFCFGQDWVHIICDEHEAIDVEKVHRRVWNTGAEYARVMSEVRFGKRGRPHYAKHEPLPCTIWTVKVICGGLEDSSDRRVTVDVIPLPGGHWKTHEWEPVYDIEDNIHMPCLMKKTSWIGGRFDNHTLLVGLDSQGV
ncbi:hypothetical protein F5J12DRAFT_398310 [Pisolithus orientalis]|uniref:uncharacterized protein n=1 Tax=Pisolithus orientalis TaxID=936130 RepID=UPI00222523C9|nr:uncharacterized protein F5J12DRAFT_398310 [Pisolithus orientalis]KAI6028861.1 hypothetical protein F5J12DRAFT_398310 [Pisolithus orientalis]